MRLGDDAAAVQVPAISTGSLGLDLALGVGGVPRGRVVEIFGPESSGKTTLALAHHRRGAEARGARRRSSTPSTPWTPPYARRIGVNIDELLVSQPDNGEQALEITELLIRSGALDIVVIDSVAALTPRAEIEGEMGDSHVGLQARLMSQALRKLAGTISKTQTTAVFINQLREKVGRHVRQPGGHAGRPGAQVLRVGAARHPPHRDAQGGHRGGRQPGARAGGQEQGRSALQGGGVRHHVRRWASPREGDVLDLAVEQQDRAEERRLVLLRRPAAGPGPRERAAVPARQSRTGGSSCGARSSRRSTPSGSRRRAARPAPAAGRQRRPPRARRRPSADESRSPKPPSDGRRGDAGRRRGRAGASGTASITALVAAARPGRSEWPSTSTAAARSTLAVDGGRPRRAARRRPLSPPSAQQRSSSRTRRTGRGSGRCGSSAAATAPGGRCETRLRQARLRRRRGRRRPSTGCEGLGYLDDGRFAAAYARRRSERPAGGRAGSPAELARQGRRARDRRARCWIARRRRRLGRRGAAPRAPDDDLLSALVRRRFGGAVRRRSRGGRAAAGGLPRPARATTGRPSADARGRWSETPRLAEASDADVRGRFLDTLLAHDVNSAVCDDRSTAVLRDLAFWL